jgi:hypothetical protein
MEAKYVANLVKQVKYAGFGESKELEIRNRIANNEPSFQIVHQPDFKNNCEAIANIKKSETKDDYYFNSYDVTVKKEGMEPVKQNIFVQKPEQDNNGNWVNSTITLKEAYNMMDLDDKGNGRSVLKDFVTKEKEHYQAWVKFDFTTKNEFGNYPILKTPAFDLDAKLENSNIKGMKDPIVREQLRKRLEKGNETNVREVFNNSEVIKGLVVNPQFKNFKFITASSSNMDEEQKKGQDNTMSQTTTEGASQGQTSPEQKNGPDNAASQTSAKDASQGQTSPEQKKEQDSLASQTTAKDASQSTVSSKPNVQSNETKAKQNYRKAEKRGKGVAH